MLLANGGAAVGLPPIILPVELKDESKIINFINNLKTDNSTHVLDDVVTGLRRAHVLLLVNPLQRYKSN